MTEQGQAQAQGSATPAEQPDPLQAAIVAAGDDPVKLREINETLYGVLKDTRGEAGTRRKELRATQERLSQLESERSDREKAEMSEIDRLKAEKAELLESSKSYAKKLDAAKAENAFIQKGASDVRSLLLHWQAIPSDEKKNLDPGQWAESQKAAMSHLFSTVQTQSAQVGSKEPEPPKPLANTGPQSGNPPQQTKKFTKVGKNSSSDELAAQRRRTLSSLK